MTTTRFDNECQPNHHLPVCKQAELINAVQSEIGKLYEELYDEPELDNPLYQMIDKLGDAAAVSQEDGVGGWMLYFDICDEWIARRHAINDFDSHEVFNILVKHTNEIFAEMERGVK